MSPGAARLLGIDLGQVRIGLALSDTLGMFAQPLATLHRTALRRDFAQLRGLVQEHEIGTLVVGLPLEMSGVEGPAAIAAREFAERLGRQLPAVTVELWDERLTTVQAERALVAADVRRGKRRQVIDSVAAALILQSYLDARSTP